MWKLLLKLYPRGHDSATVGPIARWRDFTSPQSEPLTQSVVRAGAEAIGDWLLEDVGEESRRWSKLIGRFSDLAPKHREKALRLLAAIAANVQSDEERAVFREALRRLISHHRQFGDTNWALPKAELSELETVYNKFELKDLTAQFHWLFESDTVQLLDPNGHDWKANQEASARSRNTAVSRLLQEQGTQGILAFSKVVKLPALVGRSLVDVAEKAEVDSILVQALNTEGDSNWNLAHGIIIAEYHLRKEQWAEELIDRAFAEKWSEDAVGRILLSLPLTARIIHRANEIGGQVAVRFWKNVSPLYSELPAASIPGTLQKLLEANRGWYAVHFAGQFVASAPSDLLLKTLREAIPAPAEGDSNESTMFQYYVEQILTELDKRDNVDDDEIARIEWAYLRLLEYSSKRQPKTLHNRLATKPEFFVEVLCAVYRSQNEKNETKVSEATASIATQGWALLHSWKQPPGLRDRVIVEAELESWVNRARELCLEADREIIGDQQIGQVLAHAPADADGTWPCLAVRKIIEAMRSKETESGIMVGVANKRGVTTRMPTDGGAQERDLAANYRAWSKAVRLDAPRTSALLEKIAQSFEHDAARHDEDAERGQW